MVVCALQALRLFPSLLLDKFDNLAKAEAGLIKAAQSHHDSRTAEVSSASRRIPILLAHGTEDEIVPFEQGAFRTFHSPVRLSTVISQVQN
jgi:fermentation-respiration switch protein FrsA (DUF1100 family)